MNCTGGQFQCQWCKKSVCYYHGPPNSGGNIGGHSSCNGQKCSVVVGGLTCGGKMKACKYCELWYCEGHIADGGKVPGDGGHACDIGCDTSNHTKGNCAGCKKDKIKCKFCAKAGNDYKFCAYHAMPAKSLLHFDDGSGGGGHVCQGFTTGSKLFGDSLGDFAMLTVEMSISVATLGAVNPAAATLAGKALSLTIDEILDAFGLSELRSLGQSVKEIQVCYLHDHRSIVNLQL